jgi:hypothetical protein
MVYELLQLLIETCFSVDVAPLPKYLPVDPLRFLSYPVPNFHLVMLLTILSSFLLMFAYLFEQD